MEFNKRCPGCGALFQNTSENLPGYLAPGKEPLEGVLCKRCFQMKHYGVLRKAPLNDPNLQHEISRQAQECTALFLVLDVTRPEVSLSALDWAGKLDKPVFLVANKADLLDPWLTREQMSVWLAERCGVPREQIFLISAHNRREMSVFRARIQDTFARGERVLFAGQANAGKSTILGALLKNDVPTVSRLPGTTVGLGEYQMEDGPVLVDAPGLKGADPFLPELCPDCLAALAPKKVFQSRLEALKSGQTVFFGGLAQVIASDMGEGNWVRVGIFAPDSIALHKTREERIEALLEQHSGELIAPPCKKCAAHLAALKWNETVFRLRVGEDLVVPGVGWVAFYGSSQPRACSVVLRAPEFLTGVVRPWLIPSPLRRKQGKRRT